MSNPPTVGEGLEALGSSSLCEDTHRAADGRVDHSVYLSAVGGRMAFRDAYRRCLPVVRAAEALATKWTTHGQKVDSDDFYAAIHDVCEAAMKRNGEHESGDRALAAVAAHDDASQVGIAAGDEPKDPAMIAATQQPAGGGTYRRCVAG